MAHITAYLTITFNIPSHKSTSCYSCSALFGIIITLPALRLKVSIWLLTMAFGIAIQEILAAMKMVGGRIGMRDIPPIFQSDFATYLLNLLFYCVLVYITSIIVKSSLGTQFNMVRDSELASSAFGVKIAKTKLQAFIISAIYSGIAGFLYAHTIGYISPMDFGLNTFNLLAMVIIGGLLH